MTSALSDDAAELLLAARTTYAGDASALASIAELEQRLREPLRLALAGMVKAGKSTLLNALLGEQIAPTDAGECTRIVTWYRYSATPTVTLNLTGGETRRLPVRRDLGRLVLDLGGVPPDEVTSIDVGWPLPVLKSMILIDTPGTASLSKGTSARSAAFLTPEAAPSSADAMIYLMRHLHAADIAFLEAFRDTASGAAESVCAVAVLSRSDEIGSGRIDSLLSAAKVARRYELDGELASTALGVFAVAGLVAEAARTLRESEYAAFRELAALERADRERLLVSADRFTAESELTTLSTADRRRLLARFGLFGVRLATALIRGGAASSTEVSEQLVRQSGLTELQRFVREQFRDRAASLKVRGVLLGLERLLQDRPAEGADRLRGGIERLTARAHGLRELSLLAGARAGGLPLEPDDVAGAQTIAGAAGTAVHDRLGMAANTDDELLRERAASLLEHWRRLAESPMTSREAGRACRVVIRSLEEIVSGLRAPADVVLPR